MRFLRVNTATMSVRVSSRYEEVGKYQDGVASCLIIFITSVMIIRQFKSYCRLLCTMRRTFGFHEMGAMLV